MTTHCEQDGLDEALASAEIGAFVVTSEGRIVLWNHAAEAIMGYTAAEALGRSSCELFVGREETGARLCYRGCHVVPLLRSQDRVQTWDMETRTKSARPIWVNVSTVAGSNGHGGPLTVHLFRDVTATHRLLMLVQERLATPRTSVAAAAGALTPRELEVLRLVASGADTKSVAAGLHVSPATVRNHVQNIMGKLDVHSRLQAVAYAVTHRLL